MMNKIKLLFFHQDGLLTGSAISLLLLLKGIDKNKFDINIILAQDGELKTILEKEGFFVDVLKIHGFWTAPGPNWNNKEILMNLLALIPNKKIKEYVKILNPDIIHINDKSMLCVGLSLKKSGIPIIQHLRSTYNATNLKIFAFISKYFIKKYSSFLISISEDELKDFSNFYPSSVIYNSLDFEIINRAKLEKIRTRTGLNIKFNERIISYIGPFTKTKGAFDFVEMIQELKTDSLFPTMKFLMVGKINHLDKSYNELIRIINNYNIKEKIIFLGFRQDIFNIIGASDIIVNCNRLGATGRQTIEGMSFGIPVITTNGKSEIIKNHESGLTVKEARPDLLAQATLKLLKSQDLYNSISFNAQKLSQQKFNYVKNAKKIEKIYYLLLNDR